jgi:hypothetical protein
MKKPRSHHGISAGGNPGLNLSLNLANPRQPRCEHGVSARRNRPAPRADQAIRGLGEGEPILLRRRGGRMERDGRQVVNLGSSGLWFGDAL